MPKNATDVARALAETARTINSPRTLAETLDAIVHAAQVSVPGFDHVGISIVHGKDTIETKAATGQLVWELDDLQYRLMEGPCVEAMFVEPIVSSQPAPRAALAALRTQAVQHGVRAQLGYRLYVDSQTMGGLNFYSTVSDTLDDGACEVGELFAVHATVALGRALEEDTLNIALTTRGLIGQAVGLTMARFEITSARAFQYLVRASSTSTIKVRDIAEEVVSQANARYDPES